MQALRFSTWPMAHPGRFFKALFNIMVSGKAERTGGIMPLQTRRHRATAQLWLVLVTGSSVSGPGTGPTLPDNKHRNILCAAPSFNGGLRSRAGSAATGTGVEAVLWGRVELRPRETTDWVGRASLSLTLQESSSSPRYIEGSCVPWTQKVTSNSYYI